MDADPADVPVLIDALDAATQRLLASVETIAGRRIDAPSLLPDWTRRTIVAHLSYGARATVRMLQEARTGRVAFYPGGVPERARSLRAGDGLPPDELVRRLADSCRELHDAVRAVPPGAWSAVVHEPRLGRMAVSRLLVLRLTEVEVHHTDLRVGYPPSSWAEPLIRIGLPLRFSWLAAHHRDRSEESTRVDGTWRFVCRDRQRSWTVVVHGPTVTVSDANDADVDAVFVGDSRRLFAFLLGRDDLGQPEQATRFKRAFPGP